MPDSLKFQIQLIDKLTKPGKEMASQMQKLKLQLSAAEKAVKQTEAAMAKLQKGPLNPTALSKWMELNKALQANKSAAAGYQEQILGLASKMNQAEKPTLNLGAAFTFLGESGIGAAIAFEGAAVAGGMALSLAASEAKNDTLDALEAFLDTADDADKVYNRLTDMTDHIAITQNRGSQLARELSAAGVTNADALTDAIESIGMVESVLGSGAGEKIQSIIEKATAGGKFDVNAKALKGTGVQMSAIAQALGITQPQLEAQIKAGTITAEKGIAALTKAISSKFGGAASKQVLDIGFQVARLKDDFMSLFEDVKVDGFLSQLHDVLNVFNQSTISGKALKFIVTETFDRIFKAVEAAGPYVKVFFKGLIIMALQAYIALKPLLKQFDLLGPTADGPIKMAAAMSYLAQVIGVVVGVIASWVQTGAQIFDWFMGVESYLISLPGKFYDAGVAIVNGLINGITQGPGLFADALGNMASAGLDKFKSVFGIHSPSKVMAQMGSHLMGGLEQGIDKNSTGASDAMSEAATPPPAAKPQASSGGGTVTVTFGPGSIVISGVTGAQQIAEMLPEMMANLMEQIMLEKGVAA